MSTKKQTFFRKTERYVIDGREYHDLSDIPAPVRRRLDEHLKFLEDKDKDGVPDVLQGKDARSSQVSSSVTHTYSGADSGAAMDAINSMLGKFGSSSSDVRIPTAETSNQETVSPRDIQRRKDRFVEKIKTFIATAILLGVIVFIALEFN